MSIIEHTGYFSSLPREYYTSPDIFEDEVTRVFATQWQYVGHTCQVHEAGDYFVARASTESLIITRDVDGVVRAFVNSCRHRGSELCPEGASGRTKQFVCPYHRWSYALDGHLLGAPGMRDGVDFDFAEWPLHEVNCEVFYGQIFVHLGSPDQSVAAMLAGHVREQDFLLVESDRVKLVHQKRYLINANWKVALENNLECYHCAGAHPELAVACDYTGWFLDSDGQVRDDERKENPGHFPLRPGMKTFSLDGDWVCKLPLGAPQPEGFSVTAVLTPMYSAIAYFADHGVNLALHPIDVTHTELLAQWFVHEDAVEGVDFEVERVIGVFDATNCEDKALIEGNQRGITTRRFVPGPNNPSREDFLLFGLNAYLELMGPENEEPAPPPQATAW